MIKNILYLAILITVFVISWIASSIYHNLATSTIPETTQIQITPIIGKFDTQTIQSLQDRANVQVNLNEKSLLEAVSASSSPALSPVPEFIVDPVSTESAQ